MVLFLGRLEAQKSVDPPLKAWALVRAPDARSPIVGEGLARAALSELAAAFGSVSAGIAFVRKAGRSPPRRSGP